VTDVTGVAIRFSLRPFRRLRDLTASGGRIATPVCALARNDKTEHSNGFAQMDTK
jgi:hypothetical protein